MIITICGSLTFANEMKKTKNYLKKKGFIVFSPNTLNTEDQFAKNNSLKKLLEMKPIWTKEHFEKIKISDAVLILNYKKNGIKGYFGSNTLMELSVAFFLNKKIFFLNKIQKNHPHYKEVIKIKKIILNENLDKIR